MNQFVADSGMFLTCFTMNGTEFFISCIDLCIVAFQSIKTVNN